jgi:hypothetical protein
MSVYRARHFIAPLVAFALLNIAAPFAASAAGPPAAKQKEAKNASQKEPKNKDDKSSQKDDKSKVNKQERKYQEVKQFSLKRYEENADFREEVDEAYRQKQREHSKFAYDINTLDLPDERRLNSGDKLKVEDTLYDNPLAQDYVNRVGQSLVPNSSAKLYAFRITLNPVPEARSLSTGTIYVSTGLLSQVDNEAQLAYVLGHEIAHVERDHWREDVLVQHGLDEWNEKKQQNRKLIGGIASITLGVMTGGLANSFGTGATAAFLAETFLMPNILKMISPDAVISWDKAQEDEADQLGLQYMLQRNYDPREVKNFYDSLARVSQRDKRAGLGFMASAVRVVERTKQVSDLIGGFGGSLNEKLLVGTINLRVQRQTEQITGAIAEAQRADQPKTLDTGKTLDPSRDAAARAAAANSAVSGALSAEIKAKLDAGELIGSSAEFEAVMAELKRDNGIRAFYYDMFQMARDNLRDSINIRSNDPLAHFYHGKVLKQTARTPAEKSSALASFRKAIDLDRRQVLPEARLMRAIALIDNKDAGLTQEIVANLKEYVSMYQRVNGGSLPPNMEVIYDYMQEAGEMTWAASPAMNVSTKNIEPVTVSMGGGQRPVAAAPQPQPPPGQQQPARAPAQRAGKRQ